MGLLQKKYSFAEARDLAFAKYLDVFEAYRLDETFDPQIGTSEEGMPIAKISRPILPSLMSTYLAGIVPDPAKYGSCIAERRPIIIEIWDETLQRWVFAAQQDGLTIDADGTFHLPGLRAIGTNFKHVEPDTFDEPTEQNGIDDGCGGKLDKYLAIEMIPRNLRLTVAIPLDHKLFRALKLASDPTAGVTIAKNSVDDSDRIDKTLSRFYYADCGQLYRKDIIPPSDGTIVAPGSWSHPQGIPQLNTSGEEVQTAKPDNDGKLGYIQNDEDLIANHIARKARDLGRLDRGGYLIIPHIAPVFNIGDQIERLENIGIGGDFPINGCIQEIHYQFKSHPQKTILMIA